MLDMIGLNSRSWSSIKSLWVLLQRNLLWLIEWWLLKVLTLNITQQMMLNADCSDQEVKSTLFGMDSNKAPGIDGYNAYFFKKCWHIIGVEVTQEIQQFFQTRKLPPEVNVTLLTLIPKYDNACAVKDFCPIACFTVLYKIISKILANRMKMVLGTLISDNQAAFVQGRLIFDNIILSHELVKGYNRKHFPLGAW